MVIPSLGSPFEWSRNDLETPGDSPEGEELPTSMIEQSVDGSRNSPCSWPGENYLQNGYDGYEFHLQQFASGRVVGYVHPSIVGHLPIFEADFGGELNNKFRL